MHTARFLVKKRLAEKIIGRVLEIKKPTMEKHLILYPLIQITTTLDNDPPPPNLCDKMS